MPKQALTFVGIFSSVFLLTGCVSLGGSTTETVTVTEAAPENAEPPAAVDNETDAPVEKAQPVATFDRNDPNFEFFNICEELTNEELAEVGLEFSSTNPDIDLSIPVSTCAFQEQGGFDTTAHGIQFANMSFGAVSDSELANEVDFLDTTHSSSISGVRNFRVKGNNSKTSCESTVTTSRGRLWITYGTLRDGAFTSDEVCQKSTEYLERIYSVVEEHDEVKY